MRDEEQKSTYGTRHEQHEKAQDTCGTRVRKTREALEHVRYETHETREHIGHEIRKARAHVRHGAHQPRGHVWHKST